MRFLDPSALRPEPVTGAAGALRVSIDGASATVDGRWIEAVVACERADPVQGYLLFTTEDVPDEETLTISLLDPGLRLLDSAWLGGIYATGTWSDAAIEGPGAIRFRFIDRKVWRLRLLAVSEWRLPFSEPRGSHRPLGLTRRFVLSTDPDQ